MKGDQKCVPHHKKISVSPTALELHTAGFSKELQFWRMVGVGGWGGGGCGGLFVLFPSSCPRLGRKARKILVKPGLALRFQVVKSRTSAGSG